MSKFINLSEDIAIATENTRSPYAWDAQREALEWLDSHPDQVPGRTITRSDYQKLMDDTSMPYGVGFTDGFHQAGGSIIDDPKPTNAEKWETFIRHSGFSVSGYFGNDAAQAFARVMDERGVKAPGGDDDRHV